MTIASGSCNTELKQSPDMLATENDPRLSLVGHNTFKNIKEAETSVSTLLLVMVSILFPQNVLRNSKFVVK